MAVITWPILRPCPANGVTLVLHPNKEDNVDQSSIQLISQESVTFMHIDYIDIAEKINEKLHSGESKVTCMLGL